MRTPGAVALADQRDGFRDHVQPFRLFPADPDLCFDAELDFHHTLGGLLNGLWFP